MQVIPSSMMGCYSNNCSPEWHRLQCLCASRVSDVTCRSRTARARPMFIGLATPKPFAPHEHAQSTLVSLPGRRLVTLSWRAAAATYGHGESPVTDGDSTEEVNIKPVCAADSLQSVEKSKNIFPSDSYTQWNSATSRFAGSATLAFLLLQLPQIILNTQNLINGNKIALFAVPWMGQLTGLLGNLSLLSYFAKKREVGAMVVQAVGVISTFVVLVQLTMAGSMPSTAFAATTTAVSLGLLLNFLNYKTMLSPAVWGLWEDAITIGGLSVLPQVMWSTFNAVLPPSMVPGITALVVALGLIILRRSGKLAPHAANLLGAVSAWTATLLFMWAPVAQMWTNYINPANIQGLSVFTVILAMVGNGLLLPRALFTRDVMWFTGASWGTLLQGWAILATMYMNKCITDTVFWGVSTALTTWLGLVLFKDSKAYGLQSPFGPLKELVSSKGHVPPKVV